MGLLVWRLHGPRCHPTIERSLMMALAVRDMEVAIEALARRMKTCSK